MYIKRKGDWSFSPLSSSQFKTKWRMRTWCGVLLTRFSLSLSLTNTNNVHHVTPTPYTYNLSISFSLSN